MGRRTKWGGGGWRLLSTKQGAKDLANIRTGIMKNTYVIFIFKNMHYNVSSVKRKIAEMYFKK